MTSPPTSVYTISCIVLLAMVMEYVLAWWNYILHLIMKCMTTIV